MSTDPAYQLDFTPLRDAIESLRVSIEIFQDETWFSQQSAGVQSTLMAGVIQNFEFVYELCVKMLRRQLEAEADSPDSVDHSSFRNLLRLAGEKGLVDDVEAWFTYRQLRNITSHTYNHEKAKKVCAETLTFLGAADKLYTALEKRNV